MRALAVLILLPALVSSHCQASLSFLRVPASEIVSFPTEFSKINTSSLASLNAAILGRSSRPVGDIQIQRDLFTRPRAFVLFIIGGSEPTLLANFRVTSPIEGDVSEIFDGQEPCGVVWKAVETNDGKLDRACKRATGIREELEQINKFSQKMKVEKNFTYFVVNINQEGRDLDILDEDTVRSTIETFTAAVENVFGPEILVEAITLCSKPIEKMSRTKVPVPNVSKARQRLQVYTFSSSDYPAMFVICTTVVLLLSFSALYAVVAVFSYDPSKTSIVYRLQNIRPKRL
ncbi:unnamed protein product [Caenorhabditis auriculariae]|uniref:Renin receptor-like C-terminal transmembrane spanning segment domain-containing protein n=1 Tax=Caenorhabditis auriculariae TaxID=2777116 RepID=A0A8S1HVF5_9PELO|nr:unnamed protein product [Caenorhabditis auriculariae]